MLRFLTILAAIIAIEVRREVRKARQERFIRRVKGEEPWQS